MRASMLAAGAMLAACGLALADGLFPNAPGRAVGGPEAAIVFGGQTPPPCKDTWSQNLLALICNDKVKDTCDGAMPKNMICNQVGIDCGYTCRVATDFKADPKGTTIGTQVNATCAMIGIGQQEAECDWDAGKGQCTCSQKMFHFILCTPNPKVAVDSCAPPK